MINLELKNAKKLTKFINLTLQKRRICLAKSHLKYSLEQQKAGQDIHLYEKFYKL